MRQRRTRIWAQEELDRLFAEWGGIVDCHRHLDQDGTFTRDQYDAARGPLEKKWEFVNRLKKSDGYIFRLADRISDSVEDMMEQSVVACRTYIPVDPVIGLRAIEAAVMVREIYRETAGFAMQIAAYVKDARDKETLRLLEAALRYADGIGSLPSYGRASIRDRRTTTENMRLLFERAHYWGKFLDMQIDQKNHPLEKESAILSEVAGAFRARGYKAGIAATHCISLAAQTDETIKEIARAFRDLHIGVICCPHAAVDMEQDRSVRAPTHNSIAPVPLLLQEGVLVGIGVDNVGDMYMPLVTGDIREEIRELAYTTRRQFDLETLARIATVNGRKILGIPMPEGVEEHGTMA